MSPETAATLTAFLEGVVARGTGVDAVLPGWQVAGKNRNRAKNRSPHAGHSRQKYVASFAGFAPSRRPRLTIVVIIDEPKGLIWGGYNAAPVFKNIAWQALSLLGVPTMSPPPPGPASKGEKKR